MIRIIKYPTESIPPGEGWHLRENNSSTPEGYNLWQKTIGEDLAKDATASDYIDDFVHSKNKKFKGDTKKERIKRALGAYYSQKNEEVDDDSTTNESVNENDIQGEIEDHLENCCHDSGHIKKEIPGATDQMIRNMKKKRSSERKYYKEDTSYKSLESVIREIATSKTS